MNTCITLSLLSLLALVAPSLVRAQPVPCSVRTCSQLGARAMCCPSEPCLPTACTVWSTTQPDDLCLFPCPTDCLPMERRLLATDGLIHCNRCTLRRASCFSNFNVLGPIPRPEHDHHFPLAAPLPLPFILSAYEDALSHTSEPSPEMSPDESPEETMEPKDPPFSTPTLQQCSLDFCATFGASTDCVTNGRIITCADWASTAPICDFPCTRECVVGPNAPLGSDGLQYCSVCHLQQVSCSSDFQVFGPVNA